MSPKPKLEAFPETDWSRALAVVAHPDDLEYGAAGAVARWTGKGKEISYVLASKGEAGMDNLPPEEASPIRVSEQIESARIVGVDSVEFLNHPDGLIEPSVGLRRDIATHIRRRQPELVITINHHATWGPGTLNMSDHRAVGTATLDAVRDAANRWLFRDLGLEPWSGVKRVAIAGSPYPSHAVDISDTLSKAIASLEAHKAYLEALGSHPMGEPSEFLEAIALQTAQQFTGKYATSFEIITL